MGRSAENGAIRQKNDETPDFDGALLPLIDEKAPTMILAGRIQDRLTPRLTAIIGGIITGAGLMLVSVSTPKP